MITTQHAKPAATRRGHALLDNPLRTKGTAYTDEERREFCLLGLLPPQVETLEQQTERAYEAFQTRASPLDKHIYLRALQDTNEVLFYRLLLDHVEEMMPIVYTPTVAAACEQFSHIYRRPRGLFVSYPLRDQIPEILANRYGRDTDVIVVTDGGRILGIGDQGVGGLGIPIGKLSLYTLIGGIRPDRTLPIVLDVGTNNAERLRDPLYLGWRHERLTGQEYFDFVELFIRAVKRELPNACVQWEDFPNSIAYTLLNTYRDQILSFNDDIQGTAAVTLGAILGAISVTGRPLRDQTVVILGAGSAGIGVADYLCRAMVEDGLPEAEARSRFWIINRGGVLHTGRSDLSAEQRAFAQATERIAAIPHSAAGIVGLEEVIKATSATILIGLSTLPNAFTEPIVREMARKTPRPIIFPLSNPTSKAEATPVDLLKWTEGRALIATGSPFAPVSDGSQTVTIAQCNNVYIFPSIGLALAASKARRVTDGMLLAAARALGEKSPALKDRNASLLPNLRELRAVARHIATAVALQAMREGHAPPMEREELARRIAETQWVPSYT
ncbi:MAG: NAD-dependent malic enzyme [Phycisphaerae bacterium]|jgi:malate dehydrogenase (oxaloacetate-decarboxylating)|nr:NAD-dependent malic enzyme [Phycisphaerae bacterium]